MISTINDWKPEVRALLKRLTDHGCKLISGNNGEERFEFKRMSDFIENLIACDEATLRVQMPDGEFRTLFLVLGNSPGEIVSDYGCHPLLDTVTQYHYDAWENRPQPKLTGGYVNGKFRKEADFIKFRTSLLLAVQCEIYNRNLYVVFPEGGNARVVDAHINERGLVAVRELNRCQMTYAVEYHKFHNGNLTPVTFKLGVS